MKIQKLKLNVNIFMSALRNILNKKQRESLNVQEVNVIINSFKHSLQGDKELDLWGSNEGGGWW